MTSLESDDLKVETSDSIAQAHLLRKDRDGLLTCTWVATAIAASIGWLYLIVQAASIVVYWLLV
jgi:hypothetical protein